MRTNRTFAANCAATLASARNNFGGVCHTKKIYGSTRRGLAGVALATSSYIPLMFTLDARNAAQVWPTSHIRRDGAKPSMAAIMAPAITTALLSGVGFSDPAMNDHWRQGKLKSENARVLSQVARLT